MFRLQKLSWLLLLIPLVTKGDGNEKVYDTYFNGFCYWTEEVSYHVHYASGCKVYFTCQRGKFLEFKKCPESTIFNTETRQCDSHGICKDPINVNPTYDAWWENVANVIDEVFDALNNSSKISKTQTATVSSKMDIDASTVMLPSSNLLQTKIQSLYSTDSFNESFTLDANGKTNLIESKNTKNHESVDDTPIKSSQTIGRSSESPTIYFVPMQFDTQTPVPTASLFSPASPILGDMSRTVDQFISNYNINNYPYFNFSEDTNIVDDFIQPLVQDYLKNATVMSKLNHLFDVAFKTADPLLYQILDQKIDGDKGSIKNISLKEIRNAWNKTSYMVGPLLFDIYPTLHYILFRRLGDSKDVILGYYVRNNGTIKANFPTIYLALVDLVKKYRLFHSSLPSDKLITYSVVEIRNDLKTFFDIVTIGLKDKNRQN